MLQISSDVPDEDKGSDRCNDSTLIERQRSETFVETVESNDTVKVTKKKVVPFKKIVKI